jgi:hypothetical protein
VPGITTSVTPSRLTFSRAGQTKTIKVKMKRSTAKIGEAAFGSLSLKSKGATVRVPVAVTPQAADAPDTVTGSGASGSLSYSVKPGLTGSFPITARGLDEAEVVQGEVTASDLTAKDRYTVDVPAGTRVVRYAAASDVAAADLDLYVYQVVGDTPVLVAESATGSGSESVTLFDPEPGQYIVEVAPYADPAGQPTTKYEYRAFVVGPDLPNFSVDPTNPKVTNGKPFTLKASWTGLDATKPYLGYVEYPGGVGTFVEIN